ncbi:hypothetical protein F5887DRAFT_468878 [Amanita rubescens]|nr:hypothetical protein F5887DRAFT_468878 [Amanita rubescens]
MMLGHNWCLWQHYKVRWCSDSLSLILENMGFDDDTAADVEAARCSVGLYALSIYEFLILLDDEYRLVYKSSWTLVKIIYLICRFTILMFWPLVVYAHVYNHSTDDCSPWAYPQTLIYLVLQVAPHCLLLSRTWVFTGRRKLVAWTFAMLLLGYFGSILWVNISFMKLFTGTHHLESPDACLESVAIARHRIGFVLLSAVAVDGIAPAAVIYCYICDRSNRGNLFKTFFSQAIVYVFLMTTINVLTSYTNAFMPKNASITRPMAVVVPNLLVCRFTLELRKVVNPTPSQLSEQLSIIVQDGLGSIQQEPVESLP